MEKREKSNLPIFKVSLSTNANLVKGIGTSKNIHPQGSGYNDDELLGTFRTYILRTESVGTIEYNRESDDLKST